MPSSFPTVQQVDFGKDENVLLHEYIKNKVKYLKEKTRGIRETLLPRWVRIYRGTPKEKEATFPWPGAANLVIQIAGTHCDELLSRVMAIWSTAPIYIAELYGDYDKGQGDDQREMIEFFLDKMAFEPLELDLYRVEETTFSSTIRYGTGIVKVPYEYMVEKQPVAFSTADSGQKIMYREIVRRDGPHPECVPLNLIGLDPKFSTLESSDFFFHIIPKNKYELEALKQHPEIYDPEMLDKILKHPDRNSPDDFTMELQSNLDAQFAVTNECSDEWDIYECWFRYRKDGDIYNLISYYHDATETHLGTIFNMYPNNSWPFVDAKLAYDDDTYFGYGFCEMLASYQEEVSKTHNWRRNNRDFATTGIGRANKNSKLSSIVQIFPGLLIPADEGEVEPLQFGAGALQYGTEDETLTLSLAKERTGVDPAIGGAGGGVVNAKRGIYSAQGTAAVMQQQNNRNNLRMSDMRSAHVRIGRKVLDIYSHFGIAKKGRMFGDRAELLLDALAAYKDKKLGLGIKAATASANRELEKQNDILLSATLERLYASDAQTLQALSTQGMPPQLAEYYVEVLRAKNALMKRMLRNFGRDDVERLVPVPAILKEQRNAAISGGAGRGQRQLTGGSPQIGGESGQTGGVVPTAGIPTFGAVPPGNAIQ